MSTLNAIQIGEVFTIGNTPSYPKLRTEFGYIDIRDEIKKNTDESFNFPVRLMTDDEINRIERDWGMTIDQIKKELSPRSDSL